MTTTKATKTQIKQATLRVDTLRAELESDYTRKLGRAAVNCVQESLDTAEWQLEQLLSA